MQCQYCNNEIPANSPTCTQCGAPAPAGAAAAAGAPQPQVIVVNNGPVPMQGAQMQGVPAGYECRTRLVYILLGVFLGSLGIHNFYAKRTGMGIVQLLITVLSMFMLGWVSYLWAIIEVITVSKDGKGIPMN